MINTLKNKIFSGELISKEEALALVEVNLEELCIAADHIRKHFCSSNFDICTIINAKNGNCSEDCKFCAQSIFYNTEINEYGFLDDKEIIEEAKYNDKEGIMRFSIVTSGKRLCKGEVDKVCNVAKKINNVSNIEVCASLGLLNEEEYRKVKESGINRIHNNLETSRNNFKNVCTTHTYDDKIAAIKCAQRAGLTVCSGGIMGLGETMEDRIDMAIDLRSLGIKSIPVNILNPIKGTPYENNKKLTEEEVLRVIAIFRFINPDAAIRLAGGRGLLLDKGVKCFKSGANAAISGDMLTTAGISIKEDMKIIKKLWYKVEKNNG